jgi:hypothetical protein
MAARGTTIALWSAGLGVLVLLGGAVTLRERLVEEWHIHKLRTGDLEEARRAGRRAAASPRLVLKEGARRSPSSSARPRPFPDQKAASTSPPATSRAEG